MILHLKVKPGSRIDQLFYDAAGLLNAKIKAPAQDGKANAYLVEFLAKQFGIANVGFSLLTTEYHLLPLPRSMAYTGPLAVGPAKLLIVMKHQVTGVFEEGSDQF